MTEVPDYLLQRSRDARQRLTGEGGDAGDDGGAVATADAPSGAAPAAAAAASPASKLAPISPAPVAPPKPEDPAVIAANTRHKIPLWALSVLFLMPFWGIVYVQLLGGNEVEEVTALGSGAVIYTQQGCAGCHGAAGQGGVGRQLNEGEVLLTFNSALDMKAWIKAGTEAWGVGNVIGNPDRPGGAHRAGDLAGGMPGFEGVISDADVFAVSRYIREQLSGEELTAEEIDALDHEWEELGGGGAAGGGDGH